MTKKRERKLEGIFQPTNYQSGTCRAPKFGGWGDQRWYVCT